MAAHALLIGPCYSDLRGIDEDIRLMAGLLGKRKFEVHLCVGLHATRLGILAAYEELIASTGRGDAVVVYYSGHGSIVNAPEASQLDLQYVVPTDCDESTVADFRGIASVELSILQVRLTERTPNVTVILDCCHAGSMSRDARMHVKNRPGFPYSWLKSHLDRLSASGLPVEKWRTEGSELAVRITACTTRQVSYEYDNDQGVRVGVLTESLAMALEEAGEHPVTWADVMDRVRQRIIGLSYDQRPTVEGPANRLLFSVEKADLLMSLPVRQTADGRRLRLECAPLLAVQQNDEFVVMPAGATGVDEPKSIGRLVVADVQPLWAEGLLTLSPGRRPDPSALIGARAFRSVMAAPRLAVRISTVDPRAAEVIAALNDAPMVRLATPADHEWLAEVRIESNGDLTVCDRVGPLRPPRPAGTDGVVELMKDLQILAQAAQLRRVAGSSRSALRAVDHARMGAGGRRPAAAAGVGRHAPSRRARLRTGTQQQ